MKRPAIPTNMQFNLPFLEAPAAELPNNKQRELDLALVELLISAARENAARQSEGGENEPEVDE
jgi:hypothetical protein